MHSTTRSHKQHTVNLKTKKERSDAQKRDTPTPAQSETTTLNSEQTNRETTIHTSAMHTSLTTKNKGVLKRKAKPVIKYITPPSEPECTLTSPRRVYSYIQPPAPHETRLLGGWICAAAALPTHDSHKALLSVSGHNCRAPHVSPHAWSTAVLRPSRAIAGEQLAPAGTEAHGIARSTPPRDLPQLPCVGTSAFLPTGAPHDGL